MKLFVVIFAILALCVALGQSAGEMENWPCNREAGAGWTKYCYEKKDKESKNWPCNRDAEKGWTKFCYRIKNE